MEGFYAGLRERVARHGLNLVGATPAARYDAVAPVGWRLGPHAPDVRTVVVVGNGGGAFWHAFRSRCERDPTVAQRPDPMDAFTRDVVTEAVEPLARALGERARIVYPFELRPPVLSFVHLA